MSNTRKLDMGRLLRRPTAFDRFVPTLKRRDFEREHTLPVDTFVRLNSREGHYRLMRLRALLEG